MSDLVERGDPAFLRKTASEMRAKRNLRGAMELERIARELEAATLNRSHGDDNG